jgi:nitroreductase
MSGGPDPLDLILSRRSVGRVGDAPVAREVVERLLTAAVSAPNHHLTTPWRFVVLTGAARRRVGEAHAAAVRRTRPGLPAESDDREAARLERAPVVIACIARADDGDPVRRREDRDAVAAAVQNLLLAAHGLGLAAMWRTGAMVDEPEVHAELGLGRDDAIVAFVYVGHPLDPPPARVREPADGVTEWRDR